MLTHTPQVLALPLFALRAGNIWEHIVLWQSLGPARMWGALIVNVATQYVCIKGVFMMTGLTSAVTTNLTLTVRKFVSLVISVVAFGHDFTPTHWLGSALVFLGALGYVHASQGAARGKVD